MEHNVRMSGGYARVFEAVDEARMLSCRPALEAALATDGPDARSPLQSRHLDVPLVRDLCFQPAIVSRVHDMLGDEIVLWRSNFFSKEPGAGAFDWHRDRDHWGSLLRPMINVTAWLAIDEATAENGCVELRPNPGAASIAMTIRAGECFLFDQDMLHRSGPNGSNARRLGLAIRFTLPHVSIERERLFPSYHTISLSRS